MDPRLRPGVMLSSQLIERLREQQLAIVKKLPDGLYKEYMRLEEAIHVIEDQEDRKAHDVAPDRYEEVQVGPNGPTSWALLLKSRTPLAVHKYGLIRFLKENGPSQRKTILEKTVIPAGSLSAILRGAEFTQDVNGLWCLKDMKRKKPGPSDPPAKK